MDFLEGIKYLFATFHFEDLDDLYQKLGAAANTNKELSDEEKTLDALNLMLMMRAQESKVSHEIISEHHAYNKQLYPGILQISGQMVRLRFYFDHISFDKIRKYDELPWLQYKQKMEEQRQKIEALAVQMENRYCVGKLHALQKKLRETKEKKEKLLNAIKQKKIETQRKFEESIRTRNALIVKLIMKGMEVTDKRLQREEELKRLEAEAKKAKILSSVLIKGANSSTKPSKNDGESAAQQQHVFKLPKILEFGLSKKTQEIMALKFDFSKFDILQESKAIETEASTSATKPNLTSILRKCEQQSQVSGDQTNSTKHVVIVSPSPSLSSVESSKPKTGFKSTSTKVWKSCDSAHTKDSEKFQFDEAFENQTEKTDKEVKEVTSTFDSFHLTKNDNNSSSQPKTIPISSLSSNADNTETSPMTLRAAAALRLSLDSDSSGENNNTNNATATTDKSASPLEFSDLEFDNNDDTQIGSPRNGRASRNLVSGNEPNDDFDMLDFSECAAQRSSNDDFFHFDDNIRSQNKFDDYF